jgi:putative membrane protein insertion efficiency factor
MMARWLSAVLQLPARCVVLGVRFYQRGISPLLGANCRFQPTCSEYMIAAIDKYGLINGGWRGALRILRCHPLCKGGYDPP